MIMKRKFIIVVVAVLILAGGVLIRKQLAAGKKPMPRKPETMVSMAFAETVDNGTVSTSVKATGRLMAKNRLELFAEVQGLMLPDGGVFKPGNAFSAGQTLVSIRSDDFRAGLVAQRSAFHSKLANVLPDLKADFPSSFPQWNKYVADFDPQKALIELPAATNEREKLFITGRGLYADYFNLKNAEINLSKYTIGAPFGGVLTEALVNPGTVVRPGQKLGEFIDPSVFEIEISVGASLVASLRTGLKVVVTPTVGNGIKYDGEVMRINRSIDPATQTGSVFIRVAGSGLEEGIFAEVIIPGADISDAFEINRSVLFDDDQVFVVKDSLLVAVKTDPLFFKENTVVVRGLENGSRVLSKPVPGAYAGMKVAVYQDNKEAK